MSYPSISEYHISKYQIFKYQLISGKLEYVFELKSHVVYCHIVYSIFNTWPHLARY